MIKLISYYELPKSNGESIYLRMETDPTLYLHLRSKGYKVINNIRNADDSTIYVTGKRQDEYSINTEDYKEKFEAKFQNFLKEKGIEKPKTLKFSYHDLVNYKYKLPFVLKNENQNGGREKFLISTEEDYKNLIFACTYLLNRKLLKLSTFDSKDLRTRIDYAKYLDVNFSVQEYIKTPSEYNTSTRIVTSPSNDLIYAIIKYKKPSKISDDTTLLGYLLKEVYPLSTKDIVSNTLSGGKNIFIGESKYSKKEKEILDRHNVDSKEFHNLINSSQEVHKTFNKELGIICGFDYIYDKDKDKWFLLEYHSRPMFGEFSKAQGIPYETEEDRLSAEGRVRATALSLVLKKK